MIRNFRDHAANERTFLAWVRTAIAVMAFGFLIERFDLLLKAAGLLSHTSMPQRAGYDIGNIAGILSIVIGTTMFVLAIIRFVKTARNIDCEDERPSAGSKFDVALAGLMSLVGVSSFFYLSHAFAAVQ
jgi:putative membrane protein